MKSYKRLAHGKLYEWMEENHLEGKYVVHHRDDTPECRAYNSKETNYYRWGFDLDGTFTLGKWVVFMSLEDHIKHHHTGAKRSEASRQKMSEAKKGNKHPMYGKHFSEEHRQKLSESHKGDKNPRYGKHSVCSEDTKKKISEANKGRIGPMLGKHHSDETKQKLSEAHKDQQFSEEHRQKLSEAGKRRMAILKALYANYKQNGGSLKWHDFLRTIKTDMLSLENCK